MKNKTYTLHIDNGHAWLEVPMVDLMHLGLSLKSFSKHSYTHVTDLFVPTVYLEEDMDLDVFMTKAIAKGWKVKFKESYTDGDSIVRSYSTNRDGELTFDKYIQQRRDNAA
tara:strand:- start:1183 stop:1515 length:333 start_codon:yes stop_codon:yes gene_type:complete